MSKQTLSPIKVSQCHVKVQGWYPFTCGFGPLLWPWHYPLRLLTFLSSMTVQFLSRVWNLIDWDVFNQYQWTHTLFVTQEDHFVAKSMPPCRQGYCDFSWNSESGNETHPRPRVQRIECGYSCIPGASHHFFLSQWQFWGIDGIVPTDWLSMLINRGFPLFSNQ